MDKREVQKGILYSFKWMIFPVVYKDHQILIRNGLWSADEEIWINDKKVHSERPLAWKMEKKIQLDSGEQLTVRMGNSFIKLFYCEVEDEEGLIYSDGGNIFGREGAVLVLMLTFGILFGGQVGNLMAHYFAVGC